VQRHHRGVGPGGAGEGDPAVVAHLQVAVLVVVGDVE
jgi:hypothetical protein